METGSLRLVGRRCGRCHNEKWRFTRFWGLNTRYFEFNTLAVGTCHNQPPRNKAPVPDHRLNDRVYSQHPRNVSPRSLSHTSPTRETFWRLSNNLFHHLICPRNIGTGHRLRRNIAKAGTIYTMVHSCGQSKVFSFGGRFVPVNLHAVGLTPDTGIVVVTAKPPTTIIPDNTAIILYLVAVCLMCFLVFLCVLVVGLPWLLGAVVGDVGRRTTLPAPRR